MAPLCTLCTSAPATVYCVNDDASLCTTCDVKYHANPLAARHERRPLPAHGFFKEPAASFIAAAASSDDHAVVPQCGSPPDGPCCAMPVRAAPLLLEEAFFAQDTAADFLDLAAPSCCHAGSGATVAMTTSARAAAPTSAPSLPADIADLDFDFDFGFDAVVPSISADERAFARQQEDDMAMMGEDPVVSLPLRNDPVFVPTVAASNPLVKGSSCGESRLLDMMMPTMMVPQPVEEEAEEESFEEETNEEHVNPITTKRSAEKAARTQGRRAPKRRASVYYDDESEVSEPEMELDGDDDSSDDDFSLTVSARRVRGGAHHRRGGVLDVATAALLEPVLTREERIQRYREKRARRNFNKTVRYQSRKAYADVRPRIKGRFVSPEEYAAYVKEQNPDHHVESAAAVVPCC